MVMRRYPNGAAGASFFMKEAPAPRPAWIRICAIDHGDGKVVNFPVIDDRPSLLWLINLGCIDLNQWYARCDDVHRPDYLHFDLDPGEGATFEQASECGLIVRDALTTLGMKPYVKTTGSRGLHVYVALEARSAAGSRAYLCESARDGVGLEKPETDDRGLSSRRSTEGTRRRGLQAKRVGTDAGEHLLRAAEAGGHVSRHR